MLADFLKPLLETVSHLKRVEPRNAVHYNQDDNPRTHEVVSQEMYSIKRKGRQRHVSHGVDRQTLAELEHLEADVAY